MHLAKDNWKTCGHKKAEYCAYKVASPVHCLQRDASIVSDNSDLSGIEKYEINRSATNAALDSSNVTGHKEPNHVRRFTWTIAKPVRYRNDNYLIEDVSSSQDWNSEKVKQTLAKNENKETHFFI